MAAGKREKPTIIIRREEVVEGGHHGGAWKVAYADFVTAMMAFFLLMWLLNATTQAQRDGLADYFSPNNVLGSNRSGFGKPFGGTTPNVDGSLVSDKGAVQVVHARPRPVVDAADEGDGPAATEQTFGTSHEPGAGTGHGEAAQPHRAPTSPGTGAGGYAAASPPSEAEQKVQLAAAQAASRAAEERAAFEHAAQQIRDQVRSDPALAGLGQQLAVDITPQGLRVQILDADNRPMFATGSAEPNDWSRRARQGDARAAPPVGAGQHRRLHRRPALPWRRAQQLGPLRGPGERDPAPPSRGRAAGFAAAEHHRPCRPRTAPAR
jgi:chemotaxis protein MotB